MRFDKCFQLTPRNNPIHHAQKLFTTTLPRLLLKTCLRRQCPLNMRLPSHNSILFKQAADRRLKQRFLKYLAASSSARSLSGHNATTSASKFFSSMGTEHNIVFGVHSRDWGVCVTRPSQYQQLGCRSVHRPSLHPCHRSPNLPLGWCKASEDPQRLTALFAGLCGAGHEAAGGHPQNSCPDVPAS
jgi:hypothetical protein